MKCVNAATASLCLASITHTYLLFHCFPYVGYMAVTLPHTVHGNLSSNVTVDSAGWYAGLLGTAFTTGRCLSFVPWKTRRKTSGVKNALLWSLFFSAICSLWFGLARTYISALLARFLLGFSNTLSGCVKRIAIDAEKAAKKAAKEAEERGDHEIKPTNHEELAPDQVLAVMWFGSALGPCVGGMLSNPGAYSQDTFLPDNVELSFPFLLPNVVAALLCLLSLVGVALFIEEEATSDLVDISARTTNESTSFSPGESSPLLQSNAQNGQDRKRMIASVDAFKDIWRNKSTRIHMMAYWAFSFVVVCIDEALPLFLIARFSGPGLSPNQIGWILTTAGFMVVLFQHVGVDRVLSEEGLGFYPTLKLAALLGNVPSMLVPVMLALNGGTYYLVTAAAESGEQQHLLPGAAGGLSLDRPGHLSWASFAFLAALGGILRVFSSTYFGMIGVATGRTVPLGHKDEAARIMTLGALYARAVAPVVAGILVSVFMSEWRQDDGAAVALWSVIGLLGLGAAVFSFNLHETAEGIAISNQISVQPMILDKAGNITSNIQGKKQTRMSWIDHSLRPGVDPTTVPFFIIGTHENDTSCLPHVLTPPLMQALYKHLPMSCSSDNFWLKYSLVRDGASLMTLESRLVMSKNTFVAIESCAGDIFGCFMTTPWERTNKYEKNNESFLWRVKGRRSPPSSKSSLTEEELDDIDRKEGDVEVFPRTGENDNCQLLSADRIAAGGGMVDGKGGDGFGFIVEDSLAHGSSSPCLTYHNPCLVAAGDGRFEVANMEVWAMTPFLFAGDAEKNIEALRFMQENTMNAKGDAPSSAHSAWTQFL